MQRILWTAAVVAATAVAASAHANSVSYASYAVAGRTVHAVIRLPLDDVDLLLRLDRDLDGQVSGRELDASTAAIRAYLAKHMRVIADGVAVAESVERIGTWRDGSAFQYLEGNLSFQAVRAVGQLSVHTDFLTELYPSHRTLAQISAAGHQEPFTFDATATYERRIAPDRTTTVAVVVVGVAILGLLVMARRRTTLGAIGIVLVAAFATRLAGVLVAAMTETWRRTRSPANAGSRS